MFVPEKFDKDFDFCDRGEWQALIEKLGEIIEFNPHDEEAYYNRSLCYAAIGNQEQSVADFDTAMELNPENAEVYFYWRG